MARRNQRRKPRGQSRNQRKSKEEFFPSLGSVLSTPGLAFEGFGTGSANQSAPSGRASPRPGCDRTVGARAPFRPRAVIEALDLAAGLLHRERQNGGGH